MLFRSRFIEAIQAEFGEACEISVVLGPNGPVTALTSFYFRDQVARAYLISFFHQPLGQCALFHRRGKGWHENLYRHDVPPLAIGDRFDGGDNSRRTWKCELLQVRRIRHRHILA